MLEHTIEVERKFRITKDVRESLLRICELRGTTSHVDTYFDYEDCRLTRKGWWLRRRNGVWELKCRITGISEIETRHQEIVDIPIIAERLNIVSGYLQKGELSHYGIHPFATLFTERTTLYSGDYRIDLDVCVADEGAFRYEVGEIELMVSEGDVASAEQAIAAFATKLNLRQISIRGKLIEYLSLHRSHHFHLLVRDGIIDPSLRSAYG